MGKYLGAAIIAGTLALMTPNAWALASCPPPHDDYRRPVPVWGGFGYQVNACRGDKIEVGATLVVHPSIDRGILQIPQTPYWHVDLAALPLQEREYLRDHCEPDLPCTGHFKVTVLRITRRLSVPDSDIGEWRESVAGAGEYACHTEASGTPFCRVLGTDSVIATLYGWR
jgi:hypothetical protein